MYNNISDHIKEIIRKSIKENKTDVLHILHERVVEDVKGKESLTDEELEAAKQIASEMINNHIK